jgi:hypothetical protein
VRWHIGRIDAEHVGQFANRGNVGFLCLVVLGKLVGMCGATACVGRVDPLRGEVSGRSWERYNLLIKIPGSG